MQTLEQTLSFERPISPIFCPGTEYVFDSAKVERFKGMLKAQLERKKKVEISEVAKLAGLKQIALELQTLSCGFEFLLPVETETRIPFFDGRNITFFNSINESGNKSIFPDEEDGVYYSDGFYYRIGNNWRKALDKNVQLSKTPVATSIKPFFKPDQLFEMLRLGADFNLTEAEFRYVAETPVGIPFVTKSNKHYSLGNNENLHLRYEIRIVNPQRISKFKLDIDREGVEVLTEPYSNYRVIYSLEVETDCEGIYHPRGSIILINSSKRLDLDIEKNGSITNPRGNLDSSNVASIFIGIPFRPVDFVQTITNTFDAANRNNPYEIINRGCLIRT